MSLYVVKNDKGEWLNSDEYNDWVDQLSQATFYDTFEDADDDIECLELSNAYVVELVEAPDKVMVSEEEAETLKKAKSTTVWRPAAVISAYAYDNTKDPDDEVLLEDRLMRAYANGYKVVKPKRWNVKVPHMDAYYCKARGGELYAIGSGPSSAEDDLARFTQAEIYHYGLGDCEKLEVKD